MESCTIVYTKDGSNNNIIPLTYNSQTDTISFYIKDLSGTVISGSNGKAEFDNLSSTIQTVYQQTSITTSVTLNQSYGSIALAGPFNFAVSPAFTFNLYNSFINSNSIIISQIYAASNMYQMTSNMGYVSDGIASVTVLRAHSGATNTSVSGVYMFFRIYTENTPTINV